MSDVTSQLFGGREKLSRSGQLYFEKNEVLNVRLDGSATGKYKYDEGSSLEDDDIN